MSNVDYVRVGAPATTVMQAVKTATGANDVVKGNVLVSGDDRTSLTVSPSVDDENDTVVDVYYGGDLVDRRAISQRIYDYIVEHTDWDVELDSDDSDRTIASRTKAHT